MSYKEKSQEKFIKDTFNKIQSNLTQFLFDTKYSNTPSIKLRQEMEEYKSKMNLFKNSSPSQITQDNYNPSKMPNLILNIKSPNLILPNSLIYTAKTKPKNILKGFLDMSSVKENEKKIRLLNNINNKRKKNLNINININNQYNDKYYKYNNDSKNKKFFHYKLQDKYNNTVINNEDISRGIYDMNIKKLIPRDADVSPTMNLWGNPFKIIGKNVKNIYKKTSSKDDIGLCEINRLIPNKYSVNEFYQKNNNKNKNKDLNNNKLFLTTNNDFHLPNLEKLLNNKNKTMYNINNSNIDNNNINNNLIYSKTFYKPNYTKKNFFKFSDCVKNIDMNNNILIKYIDFKLIKDSDFINFYKQNEKNWTKIDNILSNYKILLGKLNMNKAYIDSNKVLKLIEYYQNKMNSITNKDLILCLNNNDLMEKGYDINNENVLYNKIKTAFTIKIQKSYRKHLAYMKYLNLKYFIFF